MHAVEKEIPNYLRLHVEPLPEASPPPLPGWDGLCQAFAGATGWQLSLVSGVIDDRTVAWSAPIQTGEAPSPGTLVLRRPDADVSSDSKRSLEQLGSLEAVRPLAAALAGLFGQLWLTRHSLWQREAELAAGVPVVPHPREDGHLAERLEAVLRGGTEAIGCQAAALYLLDDATTHLKMRACWGLAKDHLVAAPRTLRGALADLEALVGHAVAIEDTHLLPHWQVPFAEFPAAICVPVSTPTIPLGTLWMFADHVRPFDNEQTQMVEIIAGRIAADLEREMLLRQGVATKHLEKQLRQAQRWQQLRLPTIAPLLDDWEVAGWTFASDFVTTSFYDWTVQADSSVAIALGDVHRDTIDAAMAAATLQSSVRAHGAYRHQPHQLLRHVNETLWSSSPGDGPASLFYGVVQPERGSFEWSAAGRIYAFLSRKSHARRITTGGDPLGVELEAQFSLSTDRMEPGDVLVVLTPGPAAAPSAAQLPDYERLARATQADERSSAKQIAESLRDQLAEPAAAGAIGSLLVLRRRPEK